MDYSSKKIIIADLDGTLAVSKSKMDEEMSQLIVEMLDYKEFAVISGGMYTQFQKQFVGTLTSGQHKFGRLHLLPTCATSFYRFREGEWAQLYAESLAAHEKAKIMGAFERGLEKAGFVRPQSTHGEMIEDRGTQITFSALGQQAPPELKKAWDPTGIRRLEIMHHMKKLIPEFDINLGGMTSIDLTRKGIDKAYGIRKITEHLGYGINEMLFFGDAIFEGGNDYPVKMAGVDSIQVSGPEETKRFFKDIINDSKTRR